MDDTRKGVYSLLAQHVSGIIMPILTLPVEYLHSCSAPSYLLITT